MVDPRAFQKPGALLRTGDGPKRNIAVNHRLGSLPIHRMLVFGCPRLSVPVQQGAKSGNIFRFPGHSQIIHFFMKSVDIHTKSPIMKPTSNDRGAGRISRSHQFDRHRGRKGLPAEVSAACLGRGRWAVGEDPPDCHGSGALSGIHKAPVCGSVVMDAWFPVFMALIFLWRDTCNPKLRRPLILHRTGQF